MFLIRKFEEKDVSECAMCFYESFFDCPLTENDRAFLRDYAQVRGNGPIELDICRQALEFFEIDELGLDWMDIRILETLAKTFSGRAVGLTTLASAVGEDPGTLEDVYEPYLLQCGLMIRTPQGRQATLRTFEHLGIEPTV